MRRYECDTFNADGPTCFVRPTATGDSTSSYQGTGRVARFFTPEIANPASAQDSGVFFDLNFDEFVRFWPD